MRAIRYALALILSTMLAISAQASDLFGKSNKPSPTERVPQLIVTVKTDRDEGKREEAARELRDYDIAMFPEIVPVLIDVLQTDAKVSVRIEAARSLGKIRPVSVQAGQALEAATKDGSLRVRMQARTSLLTYRIGGYHAPEAKPVEKSGAPPVVTTIQPPKVSPIAMPFQRAKVNTPKGDTMPPPLADPPMAKPAPLAKIETPVLLTPPTKKPATTQGPDLTPPD